MSNYYEIRKLLSYNLLLTVSHLTVELRTFHSGKVEYLFPEQVVVLHRPEVQLIVVTWNNQAIIGMVITATGYSSVLFKNGVSVLINIYNQYTIYIN